MAELERQITTEVFRTGSAPHAKAAAESGVGRWWWAIFIPLAFMAIYGCAADIRWLIVAVAILLLIVPTLALFGYMAALGDRDAAAALFPRKAKFNTDGSIEVKSLPMPVADDEIKPKTPSPLIIAKDDIAAINIRSNHLEIVFGEKKRRLLIPLDAFRNQREPLLVVEAFGKPAVNS